MPSKVMLNQGVKIETVVFLILFGAVSLYAQKSYEEQFDITYMTVEGTELKLDLFIPKDLSKPLPLIIVIGLHGGAWIKGNRKNFHRACIGLAERGYITASVSYRLADVAPFPAQIQDVQAAIRWLKFHADKYGIDSSKVAVTGFSSGGHLAALVATSGNSEHICLL
ncbi:alpha/beta hydrolase [Jejuia pallidilutea]|uniref:Esterase n=1 Tax=Jejuia pallidilutea TaxID=504487 RepID=A0A090WYD0_9FLAO|nr:alpha/beta hydrolase [Jejuia pallidilutea]GAL72382.1 esterase [Jejuia pallidilutea]